MSTGRSPTEPQPDVPPSAGAPNAPAEGRRALRGRTVAVLLGGVTVLLAVGLLGFGGTVTGSRPGYSADREHFDLPALIGTGHVRLDDHRGRPVVVNFFATWCQYCHQELPGFADAARATRGRVDFIAVQTQDTGDGATLARQYGLAGAGFALARDIGGTPPSQLRAAIGGQGLPVTAFYDETGELVGVTGGMLTPGQLRSQLAERLGVQVPATTSPSTS